MTARTAAWFAWSLCALCGALAVLAVLLDFYTPPVRARHVPNFDVLAGVPLLVYPTVGAFLVSHGPKNPVGWILCGMGLVFEIGAFAGAYADYALFARPGSVPGGILMLWVTEWVGVLVFPSAVLLVLLFPHGRLVARGWRAAVWMAVAGGALWALWWATWAQSNYFYQSIDNSFGIGAPSTLLCNNDRRRRGQRTYLRYKTNVIRDSLREGKESEQVNDRCQGR